MTREQDRKGQETGNQRSLLEKILHASTVFGEAFIEARSQSAKEMLKRKMYY